MVRRRGAGGAARGLSRGANRRAARPTQFSRWIALPAEHGVCVARLDDVVAANAPAVFAGDEVLATAVFRITRDADVVLQDDEEIDDMLHAMEEVVSGGGGGRRCG